MKTLAVRRGALALGLLAGLAITPALAAEQNPVVAVVNGSDIHLSEVVDFQRNLPPQIAQAPFPAILEVLINNRLITDAARKEGLQHDPEVKREVRLAEEGAMRRAWLNKKVHDDITDAAMKERYDQYVAHFKPEEEVHARHILVETEDQAKAVIADLKSGANFEDVAKAKSKDPSAQKNGGDLGFFTKTEMVPAFADAAFALKPGEVSPEPVKTQFGWHVIKVVERRLTTAPTFEDAKPVLREQMSEKIAQQMVGDLRAKAKIKTFNPDGSPAPETPAAK